jgi:small subunit ribosomal protein S13
MVSLFGLHFTDTTSIGKALLAVPGIGLSYMRYVCCFLGLSEKTPLRSVSREVLRDLVRFTSLDRLTGVTLFRSVNAAVKKKIQLKLYQGYRHAEGLPVRGQNTKTNASTCKHLKRNRFNSY